MNSTHPASRPKSSWDDQHIEVIIGILLRTGVLLSAAVVAIGGIVYLVRHGHAIASFRVFHGDTLPLRTLPGIFHATLQLRGQAIIQLGLLVLIATPVARVLFSAIAFALQRDRLYVVLTLAVLVILSYSLFGGGIH
jgi:uncharacterized membrane protein